MEEVTRRIEIEEKRLKMIQGKIDLLRKLQKNEQNFPKNAHISSLENLTITDISNMDALHEARQWLKETLGSWNDRLKNIWYSEETMIASFFDETHKITLWIETIPEKFPEELQSNNCKVVKLPDRIVAEYAYICNGENE